MLNYDFSNLSSREFERLCRDLIQAKEQDEENKYIFVESFKEGPDGGIDLRFEKDGKTVIVQVKRSKGYHSLESELGNEPDKVKKLNPPRYCLMTAAGLSPGDKAKIQKKFYPFILNDGDIIGRDDLNNLLRDFPDIELKHLELWISSTAVLSTLLYKRNSLWTEIDKDDIVKSIKLYVSNESFHQALGILKNYHYVIISGIRGIGKTILAQMLINYLLTRDKERGGVDQFVSIVDKNLDEFSSLYVEGKRQVFFYDDFLDSIVLDNQPVEGKEGKLLRMIKYIRSKPGKLLILTTREDILRYAVPNSVDLERNDIEIAKYELKSEIYTEEIRAQILYKHLAAADLPAPYIDNLLRDRQYMKLVKHQYFNPLIIERFIGDNGVNICRGPWKECKPQNFVSAFVHCFDNPNFLWKEVYSEIFDIERCALYVLLVMGHPVLISDWRNAFFNFYRVNSPRLSFYLGNAKWERIVSNLSDSFIKTKPLNNCNDATVDFLNSSLQDYLFSILKDDYRFYRELIKGSCFVEQLCRIFSDGSNECKWTIPENMFPLLNDKICQIMTNFKSCGTITLDKNQPVIRRCTFLDGLRLCADTFPEVNRQYHFVDKFVSPALIETDSCQYSVKCDLVQMLDTQNFMAEEDQFLSVLLHKAVCISDCTRYIKLCNNLKVWDRFKTDEFVKKFYDMYSKELNSLELCPDYEKAEELMDNITDIHEIDSSLLTDEHVDYADLITKTAMIADNGKYDETECSKDFEFSSSNINIDELFGGLRKYVKPFVIWPGEKSYLLKELKSYMLKCDGRYFEPFVGGGTLFFDSGSEHKLSVIGDVNPQLINAYIQIRDNPEDLIKNIERLNSLWCTDEQYNELKKRYNRKVMSGTSDIECAALMIWLSRHCRGECYDVGNDGLFYPDWNCKLNSEPIDIETIRSVSDYLRKQKTVIRNCGFEETCSDAAEGDFVYFDPPDDCSTEEPDWMQPKYGARRFTMSDHKRLAALVMELDKRKVKVMVSLPRNFYNLHRLYDDGHFNKFSVNLMNSFVKRNCNISNDGDIIITNYEEPTFENSEQAEK